MTQIAALLGAHRALFCVLAAVNHLLLSGSCLLAVPVIFRVSLRRQWALWAAAGLLSAAVGVLRPFWGLGSDGAARLWEILALLQPFVCAALLVPARHLWKGMAAALGYTFIEVPKYLILLLFFHYDIDRPNYPLEFLVELLLNAAFLLLFLWLYARQGSATRNVFAPLLLLDPVLYVLIVATLIVFLTSLLLFSAAFSPVDRARFGFVLMNIPLSGATLVYGTVKLLRARNEKEIYERELDKQVRHYAAMEKMNEDLRIFRHDLPKKLDPMLAYLEEGNADAAKEIARELGASVTAQGTRYRTGNYRLDTVLFCEQQSAAVDNITIDFPYDSVFPAAGIAPDDIYTIFPNALDNAIEACRRVAGERKITVTSNIVGDIVYVTVTNPVSGELRLKNGLPETTKTDRRRHGYGLRSIKKAAANYGSDNVDARLHGGQFTLRLSLRFQDSLSAPTER